MTELAQFTSEMRLIYALRTQEHDGTLGDYLNSLKPGQFETLRKAFADYSGMSSVLGDLKLTNDGNLDYTDPHGSRRHFDIAARTEIGQLIDRATTGNDARARHEFVQTMNNWKHDGQHSQKDIDWAFSDYTEHLKTKGKLRGQLQGMEAIGVDAQHDKIILGDRHTHRLAAINAGSGLAILAAGLIPPIGGSLPGGMGGGDGRGPGKFFQLNEEGQPVEAITEKVAENGATNLTESAVLSDEAVEIMAGTETATSAEAGAAVVEGASAVPELIEGLAALLAF